MSFVSLKFALFVAVCLVLYYIAPKKYRYIILLAASYVFYIICSVKSGYPEYVLFIFVSTVTVYFSARLIENIRSTQKDYIKQNPGLTKEEKKQYKHVCKKKMRKVIWLCVILNLLIFAFFKYNVWLISNINYYRLLHYNITDYLPFNLIMPLGISFYTFMSLGYLIDIYNGKYECEKNFLKLALFVSYFPHIVQGPISRYNELKESLFDGHDFDFYRIKSGFIRILWGLFKKLIIADRVAAYVASAMEMNAWGYDGLYTLLAVFLYSMQIYGDFSGGIDITIGVSEMFGVCVTENFERPFFSKSISEYWRRWHITLGTWFKDYIFYPLSICKPFLTLGKFVRTHISEGLGKRIPLYLPLIVVWTTTGMWHGSQSRYVVWGLLNLVLVILGTETEGLSNRFINKFNINVNGFFYRLYRVVKTFWMMSFLRLFDISKDTEAAVFAFKSIFRNWDKFDINEVYTFLKLPHDDFVLVAIAIIILFIVELIQRKGSIRKRLFAKSPVIQYIATAVLFVTVLIFGFYGSGYDAGSFIYGAF